jgi:hypothetical protein
MLQDLVNNLAPIVVLLMLLGFNDARLTRKRAERTQDRLSEAEACRAQLVADVEDRDQTIAHLLNGQSTTGREVDDARPSPIPDFVAVQHEGMAYFVAGDRVLRAPIRNDGLFLLSDAAPADPVTCDDIDPGVLLDITMQLGR